MSRISFDVAERVAAWDSATDSYGTSYERFADLYVFCIYAEKVDRRPVLLLDMDRWDFYVVHTGRINQQLGPQKTAALSTIKTLADPVRYEQIKDRVDATF